MSARESILANLKSRLHQVSNDQSLSDTGRQAQVPPQAVREAADLSDLFEAQVGRTGASFERIENIEAAPSRVAAYLGRATLDASVHLAGDAELAELPWAGEGVSVQPGLPQMMAAAPIVSRARAALAETGTVVLVSNQHSGPEVNLLADHHIVILTADDLVPSGEEIWRQVTELALPRALTFITGPSRTGDIDMTLELGVHGACAMHIIFVGKT